MCRIIALRTNKVLYEAAYALCVDYIRSHWDNFEAGDIDIIYVSTGRCASFVLED